MVASTSKKKLNMNETVSVKLTKFGLKCLNDYYVQHRKTNPDLFKVITKTYFESELWDLMRIFGSSLHMGSKVPFKGNVINLDESDSNTVE